MYQYICFSFELFLLLLRIKISIKGRWYFLVVMACGLFDGCKFRNLINLVPKFLITTFSKIPRSRESTKRVIKELIQRGADGNYISLKVQKDTSHSLKEICSNQTSLDE